MQYILIVFIFLGQFQAASQQSDLKEADSLNAVGKTSAAIALLESNSDQSEKPYSDWQNIRKSNLKEAALANYQQVLRMNPNRVLTAMDYGELLLDTDKPEAAKLFSELSEKYPENASFRFRLGLAREKLQDSSAIDDFYRTVELDSTHQGAFYKTSKYELRNGRHFNAAALAKKGLEVNANNASLLSILGQSYMVSFQFERAIEPFQQLVAQGESSEFILQNLAKAYTATGKTDQAIETYLKMIELSPGNASAFTNLGVLYFKRRKFSCSRVIFQRFKIEKSGS